MNQEGYSREAFEENEKRIDAARELAQLKPFGAVPRVGIDPSDIITAKLEYGAGKQKRDKLLGQAYDDAIQEDALRSASGNEANQSQQEKILRVGDFSRIVLETVSGNKYVIQRNPEGEGYLIANFNSGLIEAVSTEQIENAQVVKGQQLLFGNGGNTSAIASAQAWK